MAAFPKDQDSMDRIGSFVLDNKVKIGVILILVLAGSISFSWIWSVLRLGNELKWVTKNKPYICTVLANRQASLYDYQKRLLKETYNNSTTSAINQVFLGASMTTLAVERQTVNASQLHYGCAMPIFKSNLE
jgi:hypothetical protein